MGYQELKEEDVFAAIFLKNFYQADRREDNLDKDLAQNCKLTLAFHNFLKRKVTPEVTRSIDNSIGTSIL